MWPHPAKTVKPILKFIIFIINHVMNIHSRINISPFCKSFIRFIQYKSNTIGD